MDFGLLVALAQVVGGSHPLTWVCFAFEALRSLFLALFIQLCCPLARLHPHNPSTKEKQGKPSVRNASLIPWRTKGTEEG